MVGHGERADASADRPAPNAVAAPEPRIGRRAVVLVGNQAAPYSRALRIARALVEEGFEAEIAAVTGDGVADLEHDGAVLIRRYRPSGPFASMAPTQTDAGGATGPTVMAATAGNAPFRSLPRRVVGAIRRWLFWPHTVRGWWATLSRDLAPADLYHACGSLAIAPALAARDRDRRAGRSSVVLYDAIDDLAGGNNVLGMPPPVRAMVAARERAWARAADGRITVNDALAAALGRRWGTGLPLVIPNWPATVVPDRGGRPDRIRNALGLPASTRIAVFQGRLGPNLGLDEVAAAIVEVPDAVLAVIGFGRGYAASLARDADPRFGGRHRTLPAVHPDDIVAWTASADVAMVPLPPVSANQRASTPNKFWEAVAAGTPVVVGPGLPVMAALVEAHDLGVVASSLGPAELSAAMRHVLDVDPRVAAARRLRIAAVARERFSWPVAAGRYRAFVDGLLARVGARSAPGSAAPSNPADRSEDGGLP